MCCCLLSFIDKHTILSALQFGFRKFCSPNLALIILVDWISKALKMEILSLDSSLIFKAFDTMNYSILYKKTRILWCETVRSKMVLTHWGRLTHICVGKLTIIGSDNGLSPWRRQAIIWTNVGILLIRPLGTNFGEILIGIQMFSFKEMYLKNIVCEMAFIWSRPQCVIFLKEISMLNTVMWSPVKIELFVMFHKVL